MEAAAGSEEAPESLGEGSAVEETALTDGTAGTDATIGGPAELSAVESVSEGQREYDRNNGNQSRGGRSERKNDLPEQTHHNNDRKFTWKRTQQTS